MERFMERLLTQFGKIELDGEFAMVFALLILLFSLILWAAHRMEKRGAVPDPILATIVIFACLFCFFHLFGPLLHV